MNVSRWILKLLNWKVVLNSDRPKKSVFCVAPHTSNWDFIFGKLFSNAVGVKAGFLMKEAWFFFPFGYFFKKMGGVPVNRSKSNSVTQQMIQHFKETTEFHLAITPEGTRKLNPKWKKGFYYIAKGANVPIELAYIDYKKKEAGITETFYPTDDIEKDLDYIYNYYKDKSGLKPELFITPNSSKNEDMHNTK